MPQTDELPKLSRLVEAHVRDLVASGLSTETMIAAALYSAPERQVRDLLGYGAGSGLVFPYRSLNGAAPYARVKLDNPGPDGSKYRSPLKQANRIYIPPLLDEKILGDATTSIWITEGEKKALKACQEGIPCIALPGVWSWRTRTAEQKSVAVPDLDHIVWRGRTAYVVFDSDLATNPSVKLAEFGLAQELRRRGARVLAVRLPAGPHGEKVGLDDYLLTHSVEALCAIEPVEIHNPAVRSGPAILTARELLERTFAEPPAIVGGGVIVRASLNVLGGPPKIGKSSLALNIALRRAQADPWLGFPTTRGRTLFVQAEIPERELQTRLRISLQDVVNTLPDKMLHFVTYRGLRLDRMDGLQTCRRLVDQVKPDLLILDPLARFYGGDENSAREVGRLVGSLDDLIQSYGLAILLVHHTAKPNAQDPREGGLRLRGSSALFAAADSVLILDRDEGAFRLTFELRHGKEPEPLRLERTDRLWFAQTGAPEELAAVSRVVCAIPMTWSQLVAAIKADQGVSKATAERLVQRALKAHVIGRDSEGRYISTLTNPQHTDEGSVSVHG